MDLIERNVLLAELRMSCKWHAENSRELSLMQRDINIVMEQPGIDAEPVKHGMWLPLTMSEATGYDPTLYGDDPVMTHYCSYCSTECYADENGEDILSAYCPRCGAKME